MLVALLSVSAIISATPVCACTENCPAGTEGILLEEHLATCTEAGYAVFKTGDSLRIVPGDPATGHDYIVTTKTIENPDGSWARLSARVCTICGEVGVTSTAPIPVDTQEEVLVARVNGKSNASLKKGGKARIDVATTVPGKVRFASSNKKIVQVSGKGLIRAIRPGKTTITVKAGDQTVRIPVKVKGGDKKEK